MAHRIAILGSTGSIGTSAVEVVSHLGDPYRAVALSGHRHAERILDQAKELRPTAVALTDEKTAHQLARAMKNLGVDVYTGPQALVQVVQRPDVEIVLSAVVGAAGLPAAIAAVSAGKILALANKESLVIAGSLLIPLAQKTGAKLLPVDSEHSAIFQAMQCGKVHEIERVILTASGGPFRNTPMEQMQRATVKDALKHPTWNMGTKITIDSATMFNKALELIEACWLFNLPPEKIQIVIHPESIIHSMVEFVDGSVLAQLSPPDMKTPIQYALTYPDRVRGCSRKMDWKAIHSLNFAPPDFERFGALKLAYQVARAGGTAGAVLNAANEIAVAAFVEGKLAFGEICRVVELTIARLDNQSNPTLDDLLAADSWARETSQALVAELAQSCV